MADPSLARCGSLEDVRDEEEENLEAGEKTPLIDDDEEEEDEWDELDSNIHQLARQGASQRIKELVNESRAAKARAAAPIKTRGISIDMKTFDSIFEKGETEEAAITSQSSAADISVDMRDESGLTPLHFAARYNQLDTVKLLIKLGADVNAHGEDRITPLHFLARCRRMQTEEHSVMSGMMDTNALTTLAFPERPASRTSHRSYSGEEKITQIIVEYLISHGADVNAYDAFNQRPLHYAAVRANEVVASCLIKSDNILLQAQDAELFTPLHSAAMYGADRIVHMLLRAAADPAAVDEQDRTPLHLAAQTGNLKIVKMILDSSCDPDALLNARDADRSTPLHLAIMGCNLDVVRLLIERGADPRAKRACKETPLHIAANFGNMDIIKLLVEKGADVRATTKTYATPLLNAAEYDHAEVVKYLISCVPADDRLDFIEEENSESCSALQLAAKHNNVESARVLLQAGADTSAVDEFDRTPVFLAAMNNSVGALEVLLTESTCTMDAPDDNDNKEDLLGEADRYNDTALHVAAENGHVDCVRLLLQHGADYECKNEDEETPLQLAAMKGYVRVVREFLSQSTAPITITDDRMNTPLHVAAYEGHWLVVHELIDAGADVEARNTYQWTPLASAAFQGHRRTVCLLLNEKAEVDTMDKFNHTPLHLACANGHVDVVEALLDRGASMSLVDKNQNNCLDIAANYGQSQVARAIIDRPNWKDAMRNNRLLDDKNVATVTGRHYRTPMRELVKSMPDVATAVFDKCLVQKGQPDRTDYQILCDFEFVEDLYALSCTDTKNATVWDAAGKLVPGAHVCPHKRRNKHILSLMVQESREALLGHPLVLSYLRHKWDRFGQPVYYLTLFFYIAFMISLTLFVITSQPPQFLSHLNATDSSGQLLYHRGCDIRMFDAKYHTKRTLAAFVFIFTVINLMREIGQIFTKRRNYLRIQNMLEMYIYISSLILVGPAMTSEQCDVWDIGWALGAVAVCFAWINLTLFLRRFPVFGIYIVMFVDVLQTFSRFLVVFLLFLAAFALGFFMLLRDRGPFTSVRSSFLRTMVMTIGEFDYDDLFHSGQPVLYPAITQLIFILFIMVMTIIIMNLMVGLAVDDIKAVQEKARLEKLAMQVDLVLEVEGALPPALCRHFATRDLTLHPNAKDKDSLMHRFITKLLGSESTLLSTKNIVKGMNMELDPIIQLSQQQDQLSEKVRIVSKRMRILEQNTMKTQSMIAAMMKKLEVPWEEHNPIIDVD